MKDINTLTAGKLQLKERHAKLDAECDLKEAKFAQEEVQREEELLRELKQAEEEHRCKQRARRRERSKNNNDQKDGGK